LGLPPLSEIADLLSGEKGRLLDRVLARVERLSKSASPRDVAEVLGLLKELDERGVLERVDRILSRLPPLSKRDLTRILGRLERLVELMEKIPGVKA
ncbi:MAG: hypothetical protein JRE40_08225, partial [Deltaproteobacteria bacterium]|nr:hypothetical protein [Deltaproteobacteria bacterium]